MHHGLLVASQDVPQRLRLLQFGLEQRLADPGDIAMPEDPKAAGEELLLLAVGFGVLGSEELHQRLRHGEPDRSGRGCRPLR